MPDEADYLPALPYPDPPPDSPEDLPEFGAGSRAGIGARAGARILDFLLALYLPAVVAGFILLDVEKVGSGEKEEVSRIVGPLWLVIIVSFAVYLVYDSVLTSTRGQTVGKMLFSLKVVSYDDGYVPTPSRSLLRFIVPNFALVIGLSLISGGVALIVYLSALGDGLYRGWHDKAARTIVLRTR
ncbi:MAG: hypothetical protein JJLCMIEE_03477 [Acidimicrobiales bacterium]|nr:MAG: RDD family protein [Actinomycetota bacterium]MBV6510337.1 hypothetical protein [Acidimicrobiales bacterium]RIK02886.1 MAG: hypothetical protein DCC48_17445 [Acidobacteriota bacterium]